MLLVVGRTVEKHYITAIDDYVERTKHYTSFEMEVIPELKNTKSLSAEQQKEREGELILKALQPGDVVVLLDEHGREFRSIEFADWVERKMHTVNKRLVFIIGGPYGFSPKVYAAAQEKISLSKMTFSHQMIRLIFVEQLYRAFTILNNGPYHHEYAKRRLTPSRERKVGAPLFFVSLREEEVHAHWQVVGVSSVVTRAVVGAEGRVAAVLLVLFQ
jgi:23S rRNA (pseudouridine1915-N3)-methyltransferase